MKGTNKKIDSNKKAMGILITALLLFLAAAYTALYFKTLGTADNELFSTGTLKLWTDKVTALFLVVIMLRFMDHLMGFDFKEWLHASAGIEKSIYFSSRFIALCLLFGLT